MTLGEPTTCDPRLMREREFSSLAVARTAHLLLQAAHREGLLDDCELRVEGEEIAWIRGQLQLRVKGRLLSAGDRLWLDYRTWSPALSEFLEQLRELAGLVSGEAWEALVEEALAAGKVQRAAYSAASYKDRPESYLDFEGWTPEGHNLHPGAKTRQGFSLQDQLEYAPEFTDSVSLPWVAVERALLLKAGEVPAAFQLDERRWAVPVHPWQLREVIPALYAPEWKSGAIAALEREPLMCRPCTSLRTLVPLKPGYPVLKLSVGSLMTSTERSMSRYTVLQGPVYTQYFGRLREQAPELFQNVVALQETGGLCWGEPSDSRRARNLSLLCRQRPPETGPNEVAVPCSALPQPVRIGEPETHLARLLKTGPGPSRNFQAYLDILIPFHLQLYLRFGLALEAHLQNCVMVWGEGGPTQMWVRDWGGLRAVESVLKRVAPDLVAQLDPKSVTLRTAEVAEKKLVACLCSNHLTELVCQTARGLLIEETELWSVVASTVKRALEGFEETSLARRLLFESWPVKCLLRMRLGQADGGDLYHLRENPLAGL